MLLLLIIIEIVDDGIFVDYELLQLFLAGSNGYHILLIDDLDNIILMTLDLVQMETVRPITCIDVNELVA